MKKKLFSLLTAIIILLVSIAPAVFAADVEDEAYLMFADSSWTYQYWNDGTESKVVATNAAITGAGDYTVGLDFTGTDEGFASGMAFSALGIKDGETQMPGSTIELTAIKVNGADIEFTKGYTSSDDGITTRMNIYNEWVSALPKDARSFDGDLTDAGWIVVDKEAFAMVETIEISFTLHEGPSDEAYLMYADGSWTNQYWNDGTESAVVATNAKVTGAGEYTVGLDFTGVDGGKAEGLSFAAVGIVNGETTFPDYDIVITSIKVNGEAIAYEKGYTSSDDGICTRMNIFNEWVTELPVDARSADGDITDASWITVDKELFSAVETVEVTFKYVLRFSGLDTAYIMYSDAAWGYQYWGSDVDTGVVAQNATIKGAGTYTVGLDFTGTKDGAATGTAFTALGIKTGEFTNPGYTIKINTITINGEEIAFEKGYTSSDNKIETRMNIFNEWVSALPDDARSSDGVVTDAKWIMVAKEMFASVETFSINFDYIEGDITPPVDEEPTEIDIEAALKADYNAYFGLQTVSYIFRNAWYDSYGLDTPNWSHLTGWDADNAEVDYGGTFTDVVIKGNGTYTAAVELGEMGLGTDETFNMLFISTDIPSQLVKDGFITITDVKTVMDGGTTQDYTFIDTEQDYARITVLNTYNADVGIDTIPYTMPKEKIEITFTIAGFTEEAAPTAVPTAVPTEAPAAEEKDSGLSGGAIAAIAGGAVIAIGAGIGAVAVSKKKKSQSK